MKLPLYFGFAALASLVMVSCTPYDANKQKKKATKKTEQVTETPEQLKAKKLEAAKKKEQQEKKKQETEKIGAEKTDNGTSTGNDTTNKGNEKRGDYAFANKVPGKEGFVFSPYNNKVVDVRDIPSGTLVQDPTYAASEKKYFRVP